jgi:hypothetical protein
MDIIAQKFFAAVKTVRIKLEAIKQELSSLRADFQEHHKVITEATETANAKHSVPPEVRAEVNLPKGVEIRKSAADAGDDSKYQRRTLFVASLTLLAIVIYAGLVYLQWREMIGATDAAQRTIDETRRNRILAEKSLNATIEQFHLEQRAWLSVTITSEAPKVNQRMAITVQIVNTGKTYALDTRLCALSAFTNDVPHKEPLEVPKFESCHSKNHIKDWTAGNLIPPNSNSGHDSFVENPNATAVEWLAAGKTILWQYGEITYRDIFDKTPSHWVKFCYYRIVTHNGEARWVTCNTGNDIDRN